MRLAEKLLNLLRYRTGFLPLLRRVRGTYIVIHLSNKEFKGNKQNENFRQACKYNARAVSI